MPIKAITIGQPGLVDVSPSIIYIDTTDTFATVTSTGYLNQAKEQGYTFNNKQMAEVYTTDSGPLLLQVSVTSTNVSLIQENGPGDITLPTISNHIIVSTNTEGQLANLSGTAINNGSLQAGLSGTAGSLASFPSTASKGYLALTAVANTGDTATIISNVAMGQASTVSIPDPGNAAARFLIGATATPLVSGNFPQNSGTGGLVVDSGLAVSNIVSKTAANTFSGAGQIILAKANGTEAANAVTASGNAGVITTSSLTTAGGATYVITWTNTKITPTSVITLTVQGGTNTVQNITFTCVPGSGTAALTIYNNTAATSLNGTILIGYSVL